MLSLWFDAFVIVMNQTYVGYVFQHKALADFILFDTPYYRKPNAAK